MDRQATRPVDSQRSSCELPGMKFQCQLRASHTSRFTVPAETGESLPVCLKTQAIPDIDVCVCFFFMWVE